MLTASFTSPVLMLHQAVVSAFPDKRHLINENFDGTLTQAWSTFSRLLGVTPWALAKAVAPSYNIPVADSLDQCEHNALALITANFSQQNNILPLRVEGAELVVATANPFDENVFERTKFVAGRGIRWLLAPPQDIEDAIVFAYANDATQEIHLHSALNRAVSDSAENAIVKLGRVLMMESVQQRASDLHIQPYLGAFIVRIRVDGMLKRLTMLKDSVASSLIRHLKTRSDMDASNSLIPQDGRMTMVIDNREFDMRVSSLPATRGERLVIRFLDQSRVHRLSGAGFSHASLQILRRGFVRPSGMVVMTGPTGSGKTSTLYGMLAELNRSNVNIITVENPVEYRIPGISQIEVNNKQGRTFMSALRSILRQDPDIVLIGEIRDAETAEIATQAALTGHLVLTTLHTNDALTAIPRLLNLGVQPTILADSLAMIVSQRLCRKLCLECRAHVEAPLTAEERAFAEITHNPPGFRAIGCKSCDYTGYKGRIPVVDIVEMTTGLRHLVSQGESRILALDKAREGGLKSLAASGCGRIISGDTTVSEMMTVVGPSFWTELSDHFGAVCFSEVLDLSPKHIRPGQKVLVLTSCAETSAQIEALLSEIDLNPLFERELTAVHDILEKDEDIAFIITDVETGMDLPEAAKYLRAVREQISWSRLPTAVLLPVSLYEQEEALHESGVMAAMMKKPIVGQDLIGFIQQVKAR